MNHKNSKRKIPDGIRPVLICVPGEFPPLGKKIVSANGVTYATLPRTKAMRRNSNKSLDVIFRRLDPKYSRARRRREDGAQLKAERIARNSKTKDHAPS